MGCGVPDREGALRDCGLAGRRHEVCALWRQRNVFCVEVLLDALGSTFAAETRFLDPAEGRGGIGDDATIDADHARPNAFCSA